MSPQRRQTRSIGASSTKVEPAVLRTRSSNQQRTKLSSPEKKTKPLSSSPTKRLSPKVHRTLPSQRTLSKSISQQKSPQKSSQKSPQKTPQKKTENLSLRSFRRVKESPLKLSKEPTSPAELKKKLTTSKSPVKATARSEKNLKPELRKNTPKTPTQSPLRSTRATSLAKSPSSLTKRAVKTPPVKTPSRTLKSSPTRLTGNTSTQISSARKRLLASPTRSPKSPRDKKLKGLTPIKKEEPESEEDCLILDELKDDNKEDINCKDEGNTAVVPTLPFKINESVPNSSGLQPVETELSGRFLRRKWFSLKTRGGFTCLRSAILSPEEVAKVVLQHTMVDTPREQDSNFFTTKLMMRLSSRLPPTRARPSCEELVDLINTKQTTNTKESSKESKGEGTAIRVKLERRSFSDTISHLKSKPSKTTASPSSPVKSARLDSRMIPITRQADGTLTKKQEREIALQQLKNLRYY